MRRINLLIGVVLIGLGLLMFTGVFGSLLATVIIDSTPPTIGTSQPADGMVYSTFTKASCEVFDPESGVASVSFEIDGSIYSMINIVLPPPVGKTPVWVCNVVPTEGMHTFEFTMTNNNGLSSTYSGTFQIYSGLQGTWYINDIEITDPTQTIPVTTYTLTFKFVKTSGVADSGISCKAEWTGPETGHKQLTNTAVSTWTGSYTFGLGGTYTITLTADDGTQQVIMSIFGVDVGTSSFIPSAGLDAKQLLGIGIMGLGVLFLVLPSKGKR